MLWGHKNGPVKLRTHIIIIGMALKRNGIIQKYCCVKSCLQGYTQDFISCSCCLHKIFFKKL